MSRRMPNESLLRILKTIYETEPDTAILVGGQALALWTFLLGVSVPPELPRSVTRDLDSVCGIKSAHKVKDGFGGIFAQSNIDDHTTNFAKLTLPVGGEDFEVDFLGSILGVSNDVLFRTSFVVRFKIGDDSHVDVRVMHPYAIWQSRLANVINIPSKQNKYGIAQAKLSLHVLRAYVNKQAAGFYSHLDAISWIRHFEKKLRSVSWRDALVDYDLDFSLAMCEINMLTFKQSAEYKKYCQRINRHMSRARQSKKERSRKCERQSCLIVPSLDSLLGA